MPRRSLRSRLVAALLVAPACGGGAAGGPPPAQSTCPIAVPVTTPGFRATILPALQLSCGSQAATCHASPTPAGHVAYDTNGARTATDVWNDLVGAVPANAPPGYLRIAPYDVAHSWLVVKITQDSPGGSTAARSPGRSPRSSSSSPR